MTEQLTIPEVAERLRVSRRTVEREIERGLLVPLKVGSRTLVTDRALDDYIRDREGFRKRRRVA